MEVDVMRIDEAKRLARLSEWQLLVECQKESGMSIRDWCKPLAQDTR